MKYGDNCGMR